MSGSIVSVVAGVFHLKANKCISTSEYVQLSYKQQAYDNETD